MLDLLFELLDLLLSLLHFFLGEFDVSVVPAELHLFDAQLDKWDLDQLLDAWPPLLMRIDHPLYQSLKIFAVLERKPWELPGLDLDC